MDNPASAGEEVKKELCPYCQTPLIVAAKSQGGIVTRYHCRICEKVLTPMTLKCVRPASPPSSAPASALTADVAQSTPKEEHSLGKGEVAALGKQPSAVRAEQQPLPGIVCEVWATAREYVLLGTPDKSADEESGHNCDQMGCGSAANHVIVRLPRQQDSVAPPSARPAEQCNNLFLMAIKECFSIGWHDSMVFGSSAEIVCDEEKLRRLLAAPKSSTLGEEKNEHET